MTDPNIISTKTHYRKETAWKLSTGYQESYDINEQLTSLLNFLEIKQKELQEIKSNNDVFFLFMIVIQIENNEKPAMYLENRVINFAFSNDRGQYNAEARYNLYTIQRLNKLIRKNSVSIAELEKIFIFFEASWSTYLKNLYRDKSFLFYIWGDYQIPA